MTRYGFVIGVDAAKLTWKMAVDPATQRWRASMEEVFHHD